MKLSEKQILATAYNGFQRKPTRQELKAWIEEYAQHHLLLIYTANDGSLWGQWCGVPDNALPRYTTKADKQSPSPPPGAVEAFHAAYAERKRKRFLASGDFLDISENFRNVPRLPEAAETFPPVVVVVEGVVGVGVEEESQVPKNISEANASSPRCAASGMAASVAAIYARYPRKEGRGAALKAAESALKRLVAGEDPQPRMDRAAAVEFLARKVETYARSAAGQNPDRTKIPHPATWFNQSRYLDDEACWLLANWPVAAVNLTTPKLRATVFDGERI